MEGKTILGCDENSTIFGPGGEITLPARIDTGATINSIDAKIVKDLKLGPAKEVKKIKNANAISLRPVIEVDFELKGKKLKSYFTVIDRSHMKYKVLIGLNTLRDGFIIDPSLSLEE